VKKKYNVGFLAKDLCKAEPFLEKKIITKIYGKKAKVCLAKQKKKFMSSAS